MICLNIDRGQILFFLLYRHKFTFENKRGKSPIRKQNRYHVDTNSGARRFSEDAWQGRATRSCSAFMDHHPSHHSEFMNTCVCEKAFLGRPSSPFHSSFSTYSTETFSAFSTILTFIPCADVASSYLQFSGQTTTMRTRRTVVAFYSGSIQSLLDYVVGPTHFDKGERSTLK